MLHDFIFPSLLFLLFFLSVILCLLACDRHKDREALFIMFYIISESIVSEDMEYQGLQ